MELSTMLLAFSSVILLIAVGVVLLNFQFQKSILQETLEKESIKVEHQKKLLQNYIETQEGERRRIAKDLHDELGASLSISRMLLVELGKSIPEKEGKVNGICELIETTLKSTRRISHELMPLQLESLGLEKALRTLIGKASETNDELATIVKFPDEDLILPKFIELNIYRIISELISNTIKYAHATRLSVGVRFENEQLLCEYEDNGTGLPDHFESVGLGFKSIESRVLSCNGNWHYGNLNSGGFYAKITLDTNGEN